MSSQNQNLAIVTAKTGLIAIDEHSSAACLVHDMTQTGLTLTLLDGSEIPTTFVLTLGAGFRVCRVVRRSEEEIEARFADLPVAVVPTRTARTAVLSRHATHDAELRRAA